jgi:hypothetical protein
MKVTIVPLGQWDAEEAEVLNNVLSGDELIKAMGFLRNKEPTYYKRASSLSLINRGYINELASDKSWASYRLKMVAQSYLVEDLDYLELILSDYRELKEPRYSSFCKTMLKKRQNILLDLCVRSDPGTYGSYQFRYDGCYMLSSDGKSLISTALQNGKTYFSPMLPSL